MLIDHRLDLVLQGGTSVKGLRLRCEVHGELNRQRSNAILFPTWFGGRHANNRWIIGKGRALDPDRHCILVVNAIGNGESSSPSNDAQLLRDDGPVAVSVYDNVRAQADLVRALGIRRLFAVVGRSMGAQQALQWACLYPESVERIVAFCGVARTTPHNRILLQAMEDALLACPDHPSLGVTLAARIYAGWSLSQAFFSARFGAGSETSAEAWVEENIVRNLQRFDATDLLTLIRTWKSADVSANPVFGGNARKALRAIVARTLLIPISEDLIFPPMDFEDLRRHIAHAEVEMLRSTWGHRAAAPGGSARDVEALESALRRFLGSESLSTNECLAQMRGAFWPL